MSEKKKSEVNEGTMGDTPDVTIEVEDLIATLADVEALGEKIDKNTEAVRELTKIIGELTKENTKWFRAGKFTG